MERFYSENSPVSTSKFFKVSLEKNFPSLLIWSLCPCKSFGGCRLRLQIHTCLPRILNSTFVLSRGYCPQICSSKYSLKFYVLKKIVVYFQKHPSEVTVKSFTFSDFCRAQTIMKARLKGAQTGRNLLKKKSDALTLRFRQILKKIIEVRSFVLLYS